MECWKLAMDQTTMSAVVLSLKLLVIIQSSFSSASAHHALNGIDTPQFPTPLVFTGAKADGTRPKFSGQVSGTRNWSPETCVQVAHTRHTRNWPRKHGVSNSIGLLRRSSKFSVTYGTLSYSVQVSGTRKIWYQSAWHTSKVTGTRKETWVENLGRMPKLVVALA